MFSRFVTGLYMLAGLAIAVIPISASAAAMDMLASANATWTTDTAKTTVIIGPRSSGDSLLATWTMQQGLWSNTWLSIIATPVASLQSPDSIKILYKCTSVFGFAVRLTLRDLTMWQSPAYLSGGAGALMAASYKVDVTSFPQNQATGGTFNADSIKTISFVNTTDPTALTAAGTSGVFTMTQFQITTGSSAVKPFSSTATNGFLQLHLVSTGFTAPKAGVYTISLYGANGRLVRHFTRQYAAGFNRVDFSKLGTGVHLVKVTGNGFASSGRIIIDK